MNRRLFTKRCALLAPLFASGADGAEASEFPPHIETPGSGNITDVIGVRVGHFTESRRPTGCTVVLLEHGGTAGVDVRGGAPGTRETDLLNPINTVQQVNAIVLSGGSAFGLSAATGVTRYLEEKGIGFRVGKNVVPIVPEAILYDLGVGDGKIRPDADAGYHAASNSSAGHVEEGSVGAGAGATIGKLFGMGSAMKSGLGTASLAIGNTGIVVGAIVAVNAVGDVFDHRTGVIVAGAYSPKERKFINTIGKLRDGYSVAISPGPATNTTIGVVATNARLDKSEITKVAQMTHDGFARSVNPVHTPFDGDTVFALATGASSQKVSVGAIGAIAAEVMADAILRAVLLAQGLPQLPSYRDLRKNATA